MATSIKKNSSRFTIQFDEENVKHREAVEILNEHKRDKANFIAEAIYEKENQLEIKQLLEEIIRAEVPSIVARLLDEKLKNISTTNTSVKNEEKQMEAISTEDIQPVRDIKFNKEVLTGLESFGIKQNT